MIPFLDLPLQHRAIEDELVATISEVIRSGNYILGPHNRAFEAAFAAYCGTAHAVAVSSGTSALQLALLAAGVGPGDEVITVPMTFVATVAAIQYVGATPRFIDIDPETWTMDPRLIAAAITSRTRAIMPVHLHGRLADMEPILAVARAHGLRVIEDAAQAHGAERAGRRAGSFGDIGCFSFYPGKNLGACGEGGAVVTDDAELAEHVRTLRHWGQKDKYLHVLPGFNFRMDEIQAAALTIKLRHIEPWTDARRALAEEYDRTLARMGIVTPAPSDGTDHVYHVYAVRTGRRDAVRARLAGQGVQSGIHYPVPVHLQPAYLNLGYDRGDFPVTERLADETLSLPLFPGMTRAQLREVCETLAQATEAEHVNYAVASV